MSKLKDQFISARRFGVPLLAIETPDQGATISQLVQALNGDKKHAALTWDIVRGPMAGNEQGMEVLKKLCPNEGAQMDLINPTNMLARASSSITASASIRMKRWPRPSGICATHSRPLAACWCS
jgi:hypothetical protein